MKVERYEQIKCKTVEALECLGKYNGIVEEITEFKFDIEELTDEQYRELRSINDDIRGLVELF